MSNKDVKVEECKFFKKVYLGKHCELFKTPCYGKHCNFHKEFIKLAQLEQQLQTAKEENEKLYVRLYKIKDSQLKEPVNDMELEDLAIEELLDHIEESFTINEKTINNLTQQNKQMREENKIMKTELISNGCIYIQGIGYLKGVE